MFNYKKTNVTVLVTFVFLFYYPTKVCIANNREWYVIYDVYFLIIYFSYDEMYFLIRSLL